MRYFSICIILLCLNFCAQAQSIFTSTGDGDWTNPASWTEDNQGNPNDADGIPDANDDVMIVNTDNITITSTTPQDCLDLTINNGTLTFGGNPSRLTVRGALRASNTADITSTHSNNLLGVSSTGSFVVNTGATLTITQVRLSVNKVTDINGEIVFATAVPVRQFFTTVRVNSGGTWTNNSTQSFTITGSLANNSSNTWTPCSTVDGCDYVLSGTGGTINGTGTTILSTLIVNGSISNTGTLIIQDDIEGIGTFTNNSTLTLVTHAATAEYTITTLDLDNGGTTVNYTGSTADDIDIGPFNDLNVSMDAGIDLQLNSSDVTVNGNLSITSGRLNVLTGRTLAVTGNLNVTGSDATLSSLQSGSSITVGGTLTVTNASFNQDDGGVTVTGDFDISGTGAADVNGGTLSFVNMDITTGATVNVADPTITSTGTITVDNGTLTVDGSGGMYSFANLDVNTNGIWNSTAAYDPTISGNISNDGTFTGCNGSDCDYTLTSATGTITGSGAIGALSDLILNDGASYTNTNTGGLTITDRLATTSGTGSFINGANGVMTYGGSTSNFSLTNFTASAASNSVTYNSTTLSQAIKTTTDNAYHNLTINKANGIDATTTAVLTINGTLTMTSGDLIMGSDNLIIADGANIVGGSTTSYIQDSGAGVLRRNLSGLGSFTAPIGGTSYSPITVTLTSATIGGGASIDFSVTDAPHPNRDRDNTGDPSPGDDDGTPATDFLDVFWTVSGNNVTGVTYNASYQYDASDFTQTTETNMVGTLYRTVSGIIDWLAQGTVNSTTNVVTFTDADAFGDLYAMDDTMDRLPIVLLSFEAFEIGNAVILEWVTQSEENNDFYTIERSVDGDNFEPILRMAGAGNSNELITYNAKDESPMEGRSFYRLKQTDFNGRFEYSEILSVYYEKPEFYDGLTLSSNPLKRGEILEISGDFTQPSNLRITSLDGKTLLKRLLPSLNKNKVQVELPYTINSGMYLVTLIQEKRKLSKRLVIE